jgi:putative spermidine/putrescine transport system substrate-binding protein
MNRRDFLGKAAALGLGAASNLGFPSIVRALDRKPTIRVVGTHVTLQETLRRRA